VKKCYDHCVVDNIYNSARWVAMKKWLSACVMVVCMTQGAFARDQVRIVGSSTVFPFVAAAAERYSTNTGEKAPIAESIGTGAGFLEFCKGVGVPYPDIASASRPMVDAEKKLCKKHGVTEILEVPIGMDGIVVATAIEVEPFPLTRKQLFYALAKFVPQESKVVANNAKTWQDVDASLPPEKIEVYGPSTTSGTRDAFVELVFEPICIEMPEMIAQYPDAKERKVACHAIREDGAYIEAGENDNLIVQKLLLNKGALGVFGYSYLEKNADKIQPLSIEGVLPEFEYITDGSYPVARSLYVYVKQAHVKYIKGLKEFVEELVSEAAISEDGYLADKGLIPLEEEKRAQIRETVTKALAK
jgi:phosphate transport system substrate-binding protein